MSIGPVREEGDTASEQCFCPSKGFDETSIHPISAGHRVYDLLIFTKSFVYFE
jgi:hypothetical protein